jgi:hypothetical protein
MESASIDPEGRHEEKKVMLYINRSDDGQSYHRRRLETTARQVFGNLVGFITVGVVVVIVQRDKFACLILAMAIGAFLSLTLTWYRWLGRQTIGERPSNIPLFVLLWIELVAIAVASVAGLPFWAELNLIPFLSILACHVFYILLGTNVNFPSVDYDCTMDDLIEV